MNARQLVSGLLVVSAVAVGARLCFARADEAAKVDVAVEPALEFTLNVAGTDVDLRVGQSTEVLIDGKKVAVTLAAKPTRLLVTPGVSLRYPAGHGFEYETSDAADIWTLDGNDTVITVMRLTQTPHGPFIDTVIDGITATFDGKPTRGPASMTLADQKRTGVRLKTTIAGTVIEHRIFAIDAGDSTYCLMLQDSLDKAGENSKELTQVAKLLTESLKILPD